MKIIFLTLALCVSSINAQETGEINDLQGLNDSIELIEQFKKSNYEKINNDFVKAIKENNSLEHPYFLEAEENTKKENAEKIAKLKEKFKSMEYDLDIESIKKNRDNLMIALSERRAYLRSKKIFDELPNDIKNSKKFIKYCKLMQAGRSTEANLLKVLLNREEKLKAEVYNDNLKVVIVNRGNQDFKIKQIAEDYKKLEHVLSYPLESLNQMNLIQKEILSLGQNEKKLVEKLNNSFQYDFQLPGIFETGFFTCDQGTSRYLRFKKYPDLVVLDKDGTYNSIIKLDNNNPKTLNIVYHCTRMGMFGNCLEDKDKKLCQLDLNCKTTLETAEKAYKEHNLFPEIKNDYLSSVMNAKKDEFMNQEKFSVINEFARLNRLGIYSREKIEQMLQNILNRISKIEASSPDVLQKKAQVLIKQLQQQDLQNLKKNNPDDKDSEAVLGYIYASVDSEFGKISSTELIQKFIVNNCQKYPAATDFCIKYNQFKEQSRSFDEVEEVDNLTRSECPRIVLRVDKDIKSTEKKSFQLVPCQLVPEENKYIIQFKKDVEKIMIKISQ